MLDDGVVADSRAEVDLRGCSRDDFLSRRRAALVRQDVRVAGLLTSFVGELVRLVIDTSHGLIAA